MKAKRALGPDASPELRSADLTSWVSTYLERMAEVTRSKMVSRSNALAKKNANFWVLQNGVGGLATVFGQEEIPEPLRMFTGAALLESLAGSRADIAGGKRVRVSEEEEAQPGVDEEGRRVRERSDEAELGRGNVDVAMDDAGYMADDAGYMDGAVLIGDQVTVRGGRWNYQLIVLMCETDNGGRETSSNTPCRQHVLFHALEHCFFNARLFGSSWK